MVVQKFKSDPKDFLDEAEVETLRAKNLRNVNCKIGYKVAIGVSIIVPFLVNAITFFIAIGNAKTIKNLQEELKTVKEHYKQNVLDGALLQEISDYENEYGSNEPNIFESDYYEYDFNAAKPDYEMDNSSPSTPLPKTSETNRNKREVLAATLDGVPIIAESYAEQKRRNKTINTSGDFLKLYDSFAKTTVAKGSDHSVVYAQKGFQTAGWIPRTIVHDRRASAMPDADPTQIMRRTSRVMQTDDDRTKSYRRVIKKPIVKSGSSRSTQNLQELVENKEATVVLPHRHRKHGTRRSNLETMDERHSRVRHSQPVAHFHGDVSKYVYGKHHHYKGNGHLAHPEGHYVDWIPSHWVKTLGMERAFNMHNGVLTIKEPGLYFIYAQIYYVDEHDLNGYRIYKNDSEIAQCTTMTHTERKLDKRNTCYTGSIEYLEEGDRVHLRDIETMRYAYFEAGKSFFGLYKINDAKIK